MVRWQISIPPLLLCRCHRQGEGDFIQPDQAWGGEQTALQTTHITNKHVPRQWSSFGLVCVPSRVYVRVFPWGDVICLKYEALTLCSKQTQQCRAAWGSVCWMLLSSIVHSVCVAVTHRHTHTAALPSSRWLSWAAQRKTFHQTHSKRKYFSPRGEQQGLGKLILIWMWRQIMGLGNCLWIWICFSFQNVNIPYQDIWGVNKFEFQYTTHAHTLRYIHVKTV